MPSVYVSPVSLLASKTMNIVALFVIIFALSASATPLIQENLEQRTYPRFIEFPDGEGILHTVDLQASVDEAALEDPIRNAELNTYYLFTRRNPHNAQILRMNDAASVRNSNFNANEPLKVIVHGWRNDHTHAINPTIRDAYLSKSDVNVIVLDWNQMAGMDYPNAVRVVPDVGRGLGRFVNFLHSTFGVPYANVHLIGYSLGAHLVGNAGRETGSRVARITGLDPAGPLWNTNSERVNPNDGVYVECIHTDGGYTVGGLGIGSDICQTDFFPNGGISQPGCITNLCNHDRAWAFFASTVTYNHLVGNRCNNNLQITLNTCRGEELHMGNDNLRKTGSGMYRLDTGRNYPF